MTEELKQLREALRRVKYRAASLAEAQVIALEALTAAQPARAGCNHVLYETADAGRPKEICDRNGEVVLAMCKLCGKAESELEATQPAAQATPEPVTLGPLAKRNIYDAIRGAYDLGYNDARNARTVPGDSAPGYDGRSVEEDHGGALFNLLSKRLTPATPEPVGEVVAWLYTEDGETKFGHPQGHRPKDARPLVFGDTRPAPGVPDGFVLVPVEPTWEMRIAASTAYREARDGHYTARMEQAADCWRIMLAAAQAKGVDPEDLAAAGVMLTGRRSDHA